MERTTGGLALWAEYSERSVTEWGETGEGWWHSPGPKSRGWRLKIGVVSVYDRSLFCIGQSCVCVMFGWGMLLSRVTRGTLCHYWVSRSCALLRQMACMHAWQSHQAWYMTRTSQQPEQTSTSELSCLNSSTDQVTGSNLGSFSPLVCCRFEYSLYRNQGVWYLLDSWRALDEDSMCVCVCPSWRMSMVQTGRGSVASLFSCARARRVKSCRGFLTHILWPWAQSPPRTIRLRHLGLALRPWALGSHSLNQGS